MLGFAIVVEALLFRTAIVEANQVRGRASWIQFIRNAKSPELPVVILEDSGAMAGLVIAFAAVTTSELTDEPIWDGIGTLSIGVLLGIIAIILVIEMKSLLIGEAAPEKDVETIRAAVEIDPAVQQLIHMRTQHLGPEELLVGAKVELDHTLTFPEVSRGRRTASSATSAGPSPWPGSCTSSPTSPMPAAPPPPSASTSRATTCPRRSGPSRRSRTTAAPSASGSPSRTTSSRRRPSPGGPPQASVLSVPERGAHGLSVREGLMTDATVLADLVRRLEAVEARSESLEAENRRASAPASPRTGRRRPRQQRRMTSPQTSRRSGADRC